jgi:hypothetical protein
MKNEHTQVMFTGTKWWCMLHGGTMAVGHFSHHSHRPVCSELALKFDLCFNTYFHTSDLQRISHILVNKHY